MTKTEPEYGAWEHWSNGLCEIVPLRYRPGEAWALINGAWSQVNSGEASMNSTLLAKSAYDKLFATIMIALPAAAFQD